MTVNHPPGTRVSEMLIGRVCARFNPIRSCRSAGDEPLTGSGQTLRRKAFVTAIAATVLAMIVALVPGTGVAAAATPVASIVDFGAVLGRTDPSALGVVSSTYGANPLSSAAQRDAERRLDARYVRIPVGYRNGRVTSSAAGAGITLDVPALVALYRSWGYRVLIVVGGRTNDVDVQPGDATKIITALGFNGIDYTAPNEPGNQGKTLQDQVKLATMITQEGRALKPDFAIWGPVWAYYDRGVMSSFASSMGTKLAGLDYHHYAMGSQSLSTAAAMSQTPDYGREVTELNTDLAARGLHIPVTVDELNFSWRYQDGTPGGNNRFFTAVNTVWMTSALGYILEHGGRAMPYATQNGPLGMMVQAGQVNPDNRPASSPMPAYWGIANWTGGQVWPHYKNTFFKTTSSDTDSEVFAVNNEAGGYNVLLVNKSETATKSLSLKLHGAGSGTYTAYRNNPATPYAQPSKVAAQSYSADTGLPISLPPMTVTVLVLTPSTAPTTTVTAPTTTAPTTPTTTVTPPSTTAPSTSTATAPMVPTAPTNLAVTRTAGGATAAVTWQPPTSSGGSPISGYRISRDGTDSTGGGAYTTVVSAASRSFTFTLLQPTGGYRFSVQAINSHGSGPIVSITSGVVLLPSSTPTTSAVTTPTTSAPLPGAPTAVTVAGQQDPTTVTVTWQPPTSTGGSPITGYRVSRDGTDSTGGAYATVVPANTRTFAFTLLNRHSAYHFTLAAITATGTGPSATVAFTTS